MLTIAILAAGSMAAVKPVAADVYRIVDIDRRISNAGKLGKRVEQTLTVEKDGRRVTVQIGRYHTNFAGRKPEFEVGDQVEIDIKLNRDNLMIFPSHIRKS